MTSEMDNITKGLVTATVDYDTSKKLIGVATANLMPGADGIAPLSKQGAFQPVETVDFAQALNSVQPAADPVQETIDLPMLDSNAQTLKVPQTSDVIVDNPVQVENPANLTGFTVPAIESLIPQQEVQVDTTPVATDIQMPEMPAAVVADEPTELNEGLFEGNTQPQTSILESAPITESVDAAPAVGVPTPEEIPAVTETPVAPEISMPAISIEMPVLGEAAVQEQPVQETPAPVAEENIVNEIPATTPDVQIPSFSIEMPTLGNTEPVAAEQAPAETVPVVDNAPEIGISLENIAAQTPAPVAEEVAAPVAEEVAAPVVEALPVQETAPAIDISLAMAVPPTQEETIEVQPTDENQVVEEAVQVENNELEEIKESIKKHKEILLGCSEAIGKLAEELTNAVKGLEEIETKVNSIKINEPVKEEQAVMETPAPAAPVVTAAPATLETPVPVAAPKPANNLVNDAFSMIDAMASGPTL